uniref:Uncharacterized protein n=1 Tax=Vespula pensylvanica TaxID=30213 RepID=A0A834KL18_VESPE|nr:hypothetical protein H0235_014410 [Vespula pensylvanica]
MDVAFLVSLARFSNQTAENVISKRMVKEEPNPIFLEFREMQIGAEEIGEGGGGGRGGGGGGSGDRDGGGGW